jgi:hypothetical protein
MRPLSQTQLPTFLERFDNFKDAEFRTLEIISASQIKLTLATQDKARAFDWISLELLFSGVVDAKLPQNNKLHLIDLSDGISIINENNMFAFAIGACYNISTVKNSIFYIVADSLKYKEGSF